MIMKFPASQTFVIVAFSEEKSSTDQAYISKIFGKCQKPKACVGQKGSAKCAISYHMSTLIRAINDFLYLSSHKFHKSRSTNHKLFFAFVTHVNASKLHRDLYH